MMGPQEHAADWTADPLSLPLDHHNNFALMAPAPAAELTGRVLLRVLYYREREPP